MEEKRIEEPIQETQGDAQGEAALERIGALEGELAALKDRYLRLLADFENYRRRMEGELLLQREQGLLEALRAFLPILDDLERALAFAEARPESIRQGVQAIRDGFYRILASLGVEEVPGAGAPFDPRYHEAVGLLPGEAGKVVEVYQRGFRLKDRLVRPARVAVGEEKGEGLEEGP